MKVLLVNISACKGSVGKIVNNLYHGVKKSGNDCKVAFSRDVPSDIPLSDQIKIGSSIDIFMHALLSRLIGQTSTYSKNSTNEFIKNIEEYNPDVINIHSIYGYYLNMEILFNYLIKSKARIFFTFHSCWDFTGHCCYFTKINCSKWLSECKKCPNIRTYPKAIFYENTHKNFLMKKTLYNSLKNCCIISPSKWMDDLVSQTFLASHKHCVIHNGIDRNLFRPTKAKKRDKPLILCVANVWEERKGLNDILELSDYLGDRGNIVIIGLSAKQKKKIKKANITPLQRTKSQQELIEYYSEATVFFNPTYEDNYPTVNLEAIACQTPVITYDTGGAKETLGNDKLGYVVNKKDYKTVFDLTNMIFNSGNPFFFDNLSYLENQTMVNEYLDKYFDIED